MEGGERTAQLRGRGRGRHQVVGRGSQGLRSVLCSWRAARVAGIEVRVAQSRQAWGYGRRGRSGWLESARMAPWRRSAGRERGKGGEGTGRPGWVPHASEREWEGQGGGGCAMEGAAVARSAGKGARLLCLLGLMGRLG
jgi:hypothetical protein